MTSAITPERMTTLSALCEEHEEHLLTLVRKNDRIFLDPSKVGDIRSPLPKQLTHYLNMADAAVVDAFEHALRTGVVEGAANGDDSDSDTDLADLDESWRDDPCAAWAAALRCAAKEAEHGGIFTPDGECVGP